MFKYKTRQRSGFTVIELMIVVTIVGIFFAVAFSSFRGCSGVYGTVKAKAEEDARAYARQMHPHWQTVVADCQGTDTNGDSYVRCTIGNGDVTEPVECKTALFRDYDRGCVPMRNAPVRNGQ